MEDTVCLGRQETRQVRPQLFYNMSVKIRLKRVGAKNAPVYRIAVVDSRKRRDGRSIEEVGTYRPMDADAINFTCDLDRVDHWLKIGAQPSDTVASLIRKARRAAVTAAA